MKFDTRFFFGICFALVGVASQASDCHELCSPSVAECESQVSTFRSELSRRMADAGRGAEMGRTHLILDKQEANCRSSVRECMESCSRVRSVEEKKGHERQRLRSAAQNLDAEAAARLRAKAAQLNAQLGIRPYDRR